MPLHSALTGADLHEPKGVAAATSGQVYVANGAGSGAWTSGYNFNKGTVTTYWPDVTTADPLYVVFPFPCTIDVITTVLGDGALATADEVITVTRNGTDSLGQITITQSGSAEGDIDSLTPVSNNTLTAGQYLKLSNNGASTGTRSCSVTIEYTRTGA